MNTGVPQSEERQHTRQSHMTEIVIRTRIEGATQIRSEQAPLDTGRNSAALENHHDKNPRDNPVVAGRGVAI
jgi:hypothetical protein